MEKLLGKPLGRLQGRQPHAGNSPHTLAAAYLENGFANSIFGPIPAVAGAYYDIT
jgi:hypothetical protein